MSETQAIWHGAAPCPTCGVTWGLVHNCYDQTIDLYSRVTTVWQDDAATARLTALLAAGAALRAIVARPANIIFSEEEAAVAAWDAAVAEGGAG